MIPAWTWAAFKFGAKGGTGVVVNVILLTVLVDFVGIPARWAIFVAWAITLVPGYLATDLWVFSVFPSPDTATQHGQRGTLFYAVMWIGKGLNYVIYFVLLEVGIFYQGAWVVGAIVVFPWTFGANYWLWKKNPSGVRDVFELLRSRIAAR